MNPSDDILDYWPISSPPRENQIHALQWIAKQDSKYIILEAPVGSGKSLIGLTYTRWLNRNSNSAGNAFFLTPQRILQEQYEKTYAKEKDKSSHIASLYGKGNYKCHKGTTCDIGNLVKPICNACPYKFAVSKATITPNVVFNYKLALLLFAYTPVFTKRKLMVLDECHTVEEHLTEFGSISIFDKRAEKFGLKWKTQTTLKNALKWTKNIYLPAAVEFLKKLFKQVGPLLDKDNDLTAKEIRLLREYNSLEDHIDDVAEFLCKHHKDVENKFVLVHDKTMFKFKHLTGVENFEWMLKPKADKFLFMSSTILDHKGFCHDLGIDINDAAFLSIDSDFPIENRPVIYLPHMKMNASWNKPEQEKARQNMLEGINNILEIHKNDSGIIHTANFQVANWLVENLEYAAPQQVLHHNPGSGDDRNAIINQHMSVPKPTLLISPSITEGLDLQEDLSRFAIIVKVPFGFLGDQWIKKRLDLSQEWYQRRALIDIIQGGGRIVRSKNDQGIVYILDGSWGYLYSQTKHIIPRWWHDAYQILN